MTNSKNQFSCSHDWRVLHGAQYTPSGKDFPGVFECEKCDLKLHAADAIQLGQLKVAMRIRNWLLPAIAIVISLAALYVSIHGNGVSAGILQ